ncbi:MAG: hypothetical protein ACE5GD_02020 [Candidatus Geothermarchaeales archaeon]
MPYTTQLSSTPDYKSWIKSKHEPESAAQYANKTADVRKTPKSVNQAKPTLPMGIISALRRN